MTITIDREYLPIKAGWAAHATGTRLTAHGATKEEADRHLERGLRLFFAPFQRAGTLRQEVAGLGLAHEGESDDVAIVLREVKTCE